MIDAIIQHTEIKNRKWDIYTFSSISGAFWLFLCLDPFILWLFPQSPIYFLALVLVAFSTLQFYSNKVLQISYYRIFLALAILGLSLYLLLRSYTLGVIFQFIPFLLIVFWNNKALSGVYKYFRYVIMFFAALAIINSLLLLAGITLPYMLIPARSAAHNLSDISLRLHGLVVTNYQMLKDVNDSFVRACGPLQEGGHFGIILGFILLIDVFIGQRINWILLIAGLFTFSPAFIILLLLRFAYTILNSDRKLNKIAFVVLVFFLVLTSFFLFPDRLQKDISYSIYERNLERVIHSAEEQGLMQALSERTSLEGENLYKQFLKADALTTSFGIGKMDKDIVLSDFRYNIVRLGYVGFFLIIILGALSVKSKKKSISFILSISFLLVLVHRAWMLESTYIFYLCFCGASLVELAIPNTKERISIKTDSK